MIGRIIYGLAALAILVGWGYSARTGWLIGTNTSYRVDRSVRNAPGGYRSFHFWHSGYQGGK